jgi:hypothetical protein
MLRSLTMVCLAQAPPGLLLYTLREETSRCGERGVAAHWASLGQKWLVMFTLSSAASTSSNALILSTLFLFDFFY